MQRVQVMYRVRGCEGYCTDTFDVPELTEDAVMDAVNDLVRDLLGERHSCGHILYWMPVAQVQPGNLVLH